MKDKHIEMPKEGILTKLDNYISKRVKPDNKVIGNSGGNICIMYYFDEIESFDRIRLKYCRAGIITIVQISIFNSIKERFTPDNVKKFQETGAFKSTRDYYAAVKFIKETLLKGMYGISSEEEKTDDEND